MESLLKSLESFLRQFAVVPALLAFMVGLFLCIMTKNYRRMRRESWAPDLTDSERPLDGLRVDWTGMRTETMLTNRRVLQLRLSWFLSKRKHKVVALEDVHSVIWRRSVNWLYLLVGLWFVGTLNPLALLLVLLGLEAKIYSIRFDTPFAQMPWTRVAVLTFRRLQFAEFRRFYKTAQAAWARVRAEKVPAVVPAGQEAPTFDQDFRWGRAVWIYVGFFIMCALAQRVLEPHVSFDDYFFGPLYLALPVAVAARSGRDAIWGAVLGSVALFTMKFPGSGILGLLLSDGGAPYLEQYLLVAITSLLMAGLAWLIASRLSQSLVFLALCLWPIFVGVHMREGFADLSLYTKVGIAMAMAIGLMWAERAFSDVYRPPEQVAATPVAVPFGPGPCR